MESLGITINVGEDSILAEEVLSLLESIGFKGFRYNPRKSAPWVYTNGNGDVMCCTFKADNDIEVDINKLRDMVVLKRNDVADATHTDGHYSFYVGKDKNYFFSSCDKAWHGTWKNVEILKPIEEKEMKEYLVKSQDGNWREETTLTGDPADTVIEIPTGAEKYIEINKQNFAFYRNNFKEVFLDGWKETACNSENLELFNSCSVLWKRNPEPKQAEFLVKTDGGYVLQVLDENAGGEDVVRVPDGADTFAGDDNCHYFWQHRSGKKHLLIGCGSSLERYPQWVECEDSAKEWLSNFDGDNSLRILWQRNQEKEQAKFLVKTDSGYILQVLDINASGEDIIRIPDGAEISTVSLSGSINFWKSGGDLWFSKNHNKWKKYICMQKHIDCSGHHIIWQREIAEDEFKQPEDLPFVDSQIDIDVENLPDFTPEFATEKEIKTDFPLDRGDINCRAAIAFNAIRGTDLTEDDVSFLCELLNSITNHYGA